MAWLFLIVVCGIAALVSFDLHLHRLVDKVYLVSSPKKIRRHVLKSYVKNIWEWCWWRTLRLWWWFEILWIRIKKNSAILILVIAWVCTGVSGWYFAPDISKLYEILAQQITEGGKTADEYRGIAIRYFGIVAGVGAIIGSIIATARNIIANNQNKSADEQNRINERGRITESMVQAIAQIGAFNGEKPNIAIRLGGLYSLQRIMQDSLEHKLTIAKILYAYVRENAKRDRTGLPKQESLTGHDNYQLPEDIQAALSIIKQFNEGRSSLDKFTRSDNSDNQLNFSYADFSGYALENIDFSNAILSNVNLSGADLSYADLSNANLSNANLSGADLSGAIAGEAHLCTVNLSGANLSDVILSKALLFQVDLSGANLSDVILSGARLMSTDLSVANNLTQEQIDKAFGSVDIKLPKRLVPPESWKKDKNPLTKS